jgi:hypothetical protein
MLFLIANLSNGFCNQINTLYIFLWYEKSGYLMVDRVLGGGGAEM